MNHPKMKYVYVGIDSHKETHTAVILNCFCEKLDEIKFNNIPSEFEKFLADAIKLKLEGTELIFGIEDVTAFGRALTVFLTNKGYIVKHVNAGLVANERKTSNTLHKTDSFDAECAARILLSRFDSLPDVDPQDKYWALSQIVTRRKLIVKSNTALKNHLHSHLTGHYPSYSKFFTNIESKSALAFFEKFPSPSRLEGITVKQLDEFLKQASNGRQYKGKAELIFHYVQYDGNTSSECQEIMDLAVTSTIGQIKNNINELESIDRTLKEFMQNLGYRLESMNGIDKVTAAYMIAEIGDISKFHTAAKLARYAGIAPVTDASGKNDVQYADRRGNRKLNSLFYRVAVAVTSTPGKNRRILNPFFYKYYQRKISEGKTKPQALKCVQRKLVNIIWSMMKYKREYINPPTMEYSKKPM